MSDIKVVCWGLGAMGSGIAKSLVSKKGIQIIGAIDLDPQKIGKDLGEIIQTEMLGVKVQDKYDFTGHKADIVVLATSSFTHEVFPLIETVLNSKVNLITIAEEMAYPHAQSPDLADQIDALARKNSVSVLGTGINPGFVLDLLILVTSGVCLKVNQIKASRINDLSPFGPTVMRTQGVGTSREQFEKGIADGSIVGHIGFKESITMIANCLEWQLDEIKEIKEPIISQTARQTKYIEIEKGQVAGCRHIARGFKNGQKVIELIHPQQICPEKEDIETGDYIEIMGEPNINLSIQPEIPGGKGTQAITVNMIPKVVTAKPGLLTMDQLPIPFFLPEK